MLVSVGVFAGLACWARAEPPLPGVEDGAGLFKPETIAKAREQIREIRDTLHQDLSIETVPSLPPADQQRVHGMSSREQARYFDQWARERAAAAGVDGVYILICNDPRLRHVHVIVWPESRDATFPARDRERLRREMARDLGREPDRTLLHAVSEVRAAIQARQPVDAPSTSSAWAVGGVIVAFLIFWVILGLWRAKLSARDKAVPDASVSDGAAFKPGLLGGMFGAVAGHWIYDRLFRGGQPEAASPPEAPKQVPTAGDENVFDDPTRNDNENAPV
jgi:hypothetical protein